MANDSHTAPRDYPDQEQAGQLGQLTQCLHCRSWYLEPSTPVPGVEARDRGPDFAMQLLLLFKRAAADPALTDKRVRDIVQFISADPITAGDVKRTQALAKKYGWEIMDYRTEIPAMLCEHANEVPTICPCPPHCYCRRVGSCQLDAVEEHRLVAGMPDERKEPMKAHGDRGPSSDGLIEVLLEHYIVELRCDHERQTDLAICACGRWKATEQPNVGEAIRQWAKHVEAELEASPRGPSSDGDEQNYVTGLVDYWATLTDHPDKQKVARAYLTLQAERDRFHAHYDAAQLNWTEAIYRIKTAQAERDQERREKEHYRSLLKTTGGAIPLNLPAILDRADTAEAEVTRLQQKLNDFENAFIRTEADRDEWKQRYDASLRTRADTRAELVIAEADRLRLQQLCEALHRAHHE